MNLRAYLRRLPGWGRATGWWNRRRPVVTVIVPVYNVEDYLRSCLDSILNQSHWRLEIVAVNDGSTDSSAEILREYADRDPRVRVVHQANGGLGAARNTGVRHARGRFITFVDSDDQIPVDAIDRMVRALDRSGADIAVGGVARFRGKEAGSVPLWVLDLHGSERVTTVAQEPHIVRNFYTWNKIYRTAFWKQEAFRFREGVLFEDQPMVTEALCRASAIHVLDSITYRWRIRPDGSSLTSGMYSVGPIAARHVATTLTLQTLTDLGVPAAVMDGWLWTLAEHHLPNYIAATAPLPGTEEYEAVCELIREVLDVDVLMRLPAVSASSRVLLYLALTAPQPLVAEFLAGGGRTPQTADLRQGDNGLQVALPFFDVDAPVVVSPNAFHVGEHEQRLSTAIHEVRWQDRNDVLHVSGSVDITLTPPGPTEVEAYICWDGSVPDTTVICEVSHRDSTEEPSPSTQTHFEVTLCMEDLATLARESGVSRGYLGLRVTRSGVTRTGPVRGGSVAADYARHMTGSSIGTTGRCVVSLSSTLLHGFVIDFNERAMICRSIAPRDGDGAIEIQIDSNGVVPETVLISSGNETRKFPVREQSNHCSVCVDTGWLRPGARSYIDVLTSRGDQTPLFGPTNPGNATTPGKVSWDTGRAGNIYLLKSVKDPDGARPSNEPASRTPDRTTN